MVSVHVGIAESSDGGPVDTIEGNCSDACRQLSYPVGIRKIKGCVGSVKASGFKKKCGSKNRPASDMIPTSHFSLAGTSQFAMSIKQPCFLLCNWYSWIFLRVRSQILLEDAVHSTLGVFFDCFFLQIIILINITISVAATHHPNHVLL